MTSATSISQLHQSLSEECDMAMTLVDMLSEEQTCLIRLNSDALVDIALKKEQLMLSLEARFKKQIHDAEQLGFGSGLDALLERVKQADTSDLRIGFVFKTFQETVAQAQRLNDLNGTLVAEQLSSLQARINILIESTRPAVAAVYGPDGGYSNKQGASMSRVVAR